MISCPVQNVNFFNRKVFYLQVDYHGVILFVIHALEISVSEGNWRHSTTSMRARDIVDGIYPSEIFLPGRGSGPPTCESVRYRVESVA